MAVLQKVGVFTSKLGLIPFNLLPLLALRFKFLLKTFKQGCVGARACVGVNASYRPDP